VVEFEKTEYDEMKKGTSEGALFIYA